jgi:hypothetical protein
MRFVRVVRWPSQAAAPHTDDDGDAVSTLMSYTAFGRQAEDWEAHIMPRPVFDLGVELWRIALDSAALAMRLHVASWPLSVGS